VKQEMLPRERKKPLALAMGRCHMISSSQIEFANAVRIAVKDILVRDSGQTTLLPIWNGPPYPVSEPHSPRRRRDGDMPFYTSMSFPSSAHSQGISSSLASMSSLIWVTIKRFGCSSSR